MHDSDMSFVGASVEHGRLLTEAELAAWKPRNNASPYRPEEEPDES